MYCGCKLHKTRGTWLGLYNTCRQKFIGLTWRQEKENHIDHHQISKMVVKVSDGYSLWIHVTSC